MAKNPLEDNKIAQPKRTAQEWCDFGNAKLAGEIPCEHKGYTNAERIAKGLPPMRWVVEWGKPTPELLPMPERSEPQRYYWQDDQ